jgi:TRAP-type C4-dicarboxylate transport system permease small subunit
MIDLSKNGVVSKLLMKTIAVLENFSCIMIFIMVILTFADVIGRYLLAAPIFGASEMISALLALAIFAGLGVTNARDDHIVVELFDHSVRKLSPRIYDFMIHTFSVCVMALIAFVLCEHAIESYQQNARTYVLEMPTFYLTGSVAFLAFVSVLSQIAGLGLKLFGNSEAHSDDK